MKTVADALVVIRTKTFMHIDKDGIFDSQAIYDAAGLKNSDVERIIKGFWNTMSYLHVEIFGKEIGGDEYPGTDILALAQLRDTSSA